MVASDFALRLAEPRPRRSGETAGETLQQGGNLCYLAAVLEDCNNVALIDADRTEAARQPSDPLAKLAVDDLLLRRAEMILTKMAIPPPCRFQLVALSVARSAD